MAIISLHSALEVFLGEFFEEKKIKVQPIEIEMYNELLKSNRLIHKFLHLSSFLFYKRSLIIENRNLFDSMLNLNKLRNCVAHEGTALKHKMLIKKSNEDIYSIIEDLIWDTENTINWVQCLENEISKIEGNQ
jgi:hypothetical protein